MFIQLKNNNNKTEAETERENRIEKGSPLDPKQTGKDERFYQFCHYFLTDFPLFHDVILSALPPYVKVMAKCHPTVSKTRRN